MSGNRSAVFSYHFNGVNFNFKDAISGKIPRENQKKVQTHGQGLGRGLAGDMGLNFLFPTCQVRVIRFYVSCLLLLLLLLFPLLLLLRLLLPRPPLPPHRCLPRPSAQMRLAIHSVRCRTSTRTIHAQCSLPDLNHEHPRPVFPAGPQPRSGEVTLAWFCRVYT